MTDEAFMRRAIEEAANAKRAGNLPFGAVVVVNNLIVGRGHSTEVRDRDVTAHAEMHAIREASRKLGRDLSAATIFASGEPCTMCASAIYHAQIGRIVIGATRADLPQVFRRRRIGLVELARDAAYTPIIKVGIEVERAKALFTDLDTKSA